MDRHSWPESTLYAANPVAWRGERVMGNPGRGPGRSGLEPQAAIRPAPEELRGRGSSASCSRR